MAGIYIHIPFCKKKCTYCDFHTVVAPNQIPNVISAITKELEIRKEYLKDEIVKTIYFGGGTPSILSKDDFELIFATIYHLFKIDTQAEITFEANPDDLSIEYLRTINSLPFNRISIGIQSFNDDELERINRRHTGEQAIEAVQNAQKMGFKNISIDLIYGLPLQTLDGWEQQIAIALKLNIQHISAYGLTFEQGTPLWKQREKGLVKTVEDDNMNSMHSILIETLEENGFEAYEISNFAKVGYRSQHNSAYWKLEPYLGLGPSAHSFDGKSRQWNISSNTKYITAITKGEAFYEIEELTTNERYNDYVMISLRTSDGINLQVLEQLFGAEMTDYCLKNIKQFINTKKVEITNNSLKLTKEGIQISNIIITQIIKIE